MDAVTVRLAGSFGVTVAGLSKLGPGLGSPKAKRLLMLLAVHRGRDVGVDRIVDELWDVDLPRRPERNVASLVSRLRAVLGSEVIIGGPLDKLKLRHKHRLDPATFRHLGRGEPLSPAPPFCFGQVPKRALRSFEFLKPLKQLLS